MSSVQAKDAKYKYVGQDFPIHDARGKATGDIKYTGDLRLDGMLAVKLLFSPLPHAKIKRIEAGKALALPGVVGVFTHENTPATAFNTQVWFLGQSAIADQRLFPGTVRYRGDQVAAVVAEDEQTAARAVKLLEVEYEPLPAVFDPEEALNGNVQIHPGGSPFFTKEIKCGDAGRVMQEAAIVVEDRIETPKIHHAAMEPHAWIAYPDHTGKITVLTPCQILYSVRVLVATVLGLPFSKVRIIKANMGGSFGGKQEVTFEPLCAYLAQVTGKPVNLVLERQECIVSTRTRTRVIGYIRTAVDASGKILARETRTIADAGAYTSNGVAVSIAMGKKLFRLYRIENQSFTGLSVHTNTPVSGAARGYGSPQIHVIGEINIDHAACRLGMDPVEFRLKNLVYPYDLDLSGGPPLGNARIRDCVEKGAAEFNWSAKRNRPQDTGRFRRGVGMACATHVNGYYGAMQELVTMTLRMLEDGSMILNAALHELGTGTVMIMKQIIAEVLDIHPDKIEAPEGDTETSPYDIGAQASRTAHVCGACAKKVAEKVREMLQAEAAKIWGCSPEDIVMEAEYIWQQGKPLDKLSYGEMVCLIQKINCREIIATEQYNAQANPASFGAHFAEVEVDIYTGRVRVLDVVAVHDVGRAINPGFVRGQIHGGVQMGLGLALLEDLAIDPRTGKARADSLRKYHVFNAPEMPPVKVFLIEEGEDHGPYGAKSIGEIATIPIAPAVVNAVNHALGTNLTTLPLTPERITAALDQLEQE